MGRQRQVKHAVATRRHFKGPKMGVKFLKILGAVVASTSAKPKEHSPNNTSPEMPLAVSEDTADGGRSPFAYT